MPILEETVENSLAVISKLRHDIADVVEESKIG